MPRLVVRSYASSTQSDSVGDGYLSASINFTAVTAASISLWVKKQTTKGQPGIVEFNSTEHGVTPWFELGDNRNVSGAVLQGQAAWFMNGSYQIALSIEEFQWTHLALTWNGVTWTAYKNGVSVGTGTLNANQANAITLWLGTGVSTTWDGLFSEALLFDSALTAPQVMSVYSADSYARSHLKGEWLMSEGTGVTAADTSGSGFDLTLINTATWNFDVPFRPRINIRNTPFSIDIVNSGIYAVSSANTGLAGFPAYSMFTWAHLNQTLYGSSRGLLATGGFSAVGTALEHDNSGNLVGLQNAGGFFLGTKFNLIGAWHYIGLTFSGGAGGTWKLWADGLLLGSKVNPGGAPPLFDGKFVIGCDYGGSLSCDGLFNTCLLYNRAISQQEIFNAYNADLIAQNGLIIYYKCDEGAGGFMADSSPSGNGGLNFGTWSSNSAFRSRTLNSQARTPDSQARILVP